MITAKEARQKTKDGTADKTSELLAKAEECIEGYAARGCNNCYVNCEGYPGLSITDCISELLTNGFKAQLNTYNSMPHRIEISWS